MINNGGIAEVYQVGGWGPNGNTGCHDDCATLYVHYPPPPPPHTHTHTHLQWSEETAQWDKV